MLPGTFISTGTTHESVISTCIRKRVEPTSPNDAPLGCTHLFAAWIQRTYMPVIAHADQGDVEDLRAKRRRAVTERSERILGR